MSLPGITFLDHTADVGMDVEAASLEELLHRSALGMLALLQGREEDDEQPGREPGGQPDGEPAGEPDGDPAAPPTESAAGRRLEIRAGTPAGLLAGWLRELLFLHEVERRDYHALTPAVLGPGRLEGVVWTRPGGFAVREIKGVTYHELRAAERAGRWSARVIFDV